MDYYYYNNDNHNDNKVILKAILIIMFIICLMFGYYIYLLKNGNSSLSTSCPYYIHVNNNENKENNGNNNEKENNNEKTIIQMTPPLQPLLKDPFREYDYRTYHDPLVSPKRRDDYNLPVLPVPTRGYPAPFKKMGLLINNDVHNHEKYKILILMGRNKFHNSNVYDYYAVDNDKESVLKFNIDSTKELQNNDVVFIKELNTSYQVSLDKILDADYDPYIY